MASGVVFRRIGGKIIPIGGYEAKGKKASAGGKAAAVAVGTKASKGGAKKAVQANKAFSSISTVAAIGSGLIAGLSWGSGRKIAIGHAASLALDVGGTGAAAAAYAGKNNLKARAAGAAKLEGMNYALGYGTWAAVSAANPVARKQIMGWATKAVTVGKAFGKRIRL